LLNVAGIIITFMTTLTSYYLMKLLYKFVLMNLETEKVNLYRGLKKRIYIYKFRLFYYLFEVAQNYTQNFYYNGLIRIYLSIAYDLNMDIFLQINSAYFVGISIFLLISTYSAVLMLLL
jgi:hypothetical protein